ncbi:hypothetical protein AB6H26_14710 [Providencia hangzhouensis]|uniref:Phage tail protein n=1 Tax=Providencia rettgeri TaxID=587 RepID=A0A9N8D286_PRORE|nr:hypothetical protein [Providencia rettgeri]CAB5645793.1 Uncharacterised protein [Providencia rettgeri]CAB5713113.1 Uncharacterised protein [Providencia rettgeri]CAC9220723.1 Uncharacterised protein [Providencia rettgeri]CAC9268882.1 Uncharacterised protein [Providencia rettgeri]
MFGLDNSSGVNVMPTIAPNSSQDPLWFTEGGSGLAASYPGQDWFNQIQAELLNILKEAGLSPEKGKLNQLTLAIKKINKEIYPLVQKLGDSNSAVMSQKAVSEAISESQVNVPDATTEIKGKVKLTEELGSSTELVLNQKAVSLNFDKQGSEINKINTLIPPSVISTVKNKMIIEVIESDQSTGNGEIITYRLTKTGWWVREKLVTGGYSGGASLPDNKCPVWRLGQLFICPHILTLKQTLSDKSANVSSWDFSPDQFVKGDGINKVKFHQISGGANEFIEFKTTTKEKEINFLFAATSTTDALMTVEIYVGNTLISTEKINTIGVGIGANFNTYVSSVKNPRPGSEIRVKFIKGSDRYAYIAGINVNFDTHIADDVDKVYWSILNKNQLIRPTQTGAMCYVFKESETDQFGGESHGGETPLSQKIYVDNAERVLTNNSVFSCDSFRVVQETQIVWSAANIITCFTEHRFNPDGTHEFIGSFVPTVGFKTHIAYCPMFTVDSNYFRRVTSPEYIKMDEYPNGSSVDFDYPINKFEIQGRDNAYTAGIIWSSSLDNNGVSNLLVKPYGDSSTKLYSGPAINKLVTLKPFSIHQFRYYF